MAPIALPAPPAERRIVLERVSWSLYEQLLAEIGDGPVRLTYDEGRLEIMAPSSLHDRVKTTLGRLIEALADDLGIMAEGYGSMTMRREELLKGLEPDECYYVARAANVIGTERIDLGRDPPPDLAIEVDLSPPSVAREPIYAALGVPEIWRWDGSTLTTLHLGADGRYSESEVSLSFPGLRPGDLEPFVTLALSVGQSAAVMAFREWLRGARSAPPGSAGVSPAVPGGK